MKIILKFKDGLAVTQDLGSEFRIEGTGNLFELLRQMKLSNAPININDQIERSFNDLYSFEVVLD
ncbi:hypothetical protein [Desulforamulus aquiferis]|uniref:Uncharacterized protein n=1 Tax=Desulforamulus aquiferis TaxID=1397668 RepID=A0AAW7ZAJ9_9FIRM|nr:hypothetical protein [Desulforamulus aquiferis]MDO7786096.1 hypothetical protein [Desulforamulus aquiferis]